MAAPGPHFIVAMPKPRLWLHRLPLIAGSSIGLVAVYRTLTAGTTAYQGIYALAFSGATIVILAGLLRFNRVGVSAKGIAPPTKPIKAFLQETWILPWSAIDEVETLVLGETTHGGRRRLRIRVSSTSHTLDWYVMSPAAYRWFGEVSQANRFFDILLRIGKAIKEKGPPLTGQEAEGILGLSKPLASHGP